MDAVDFWKAMYSGTLLFGILCVNALWLVLLVWMLLRQLRTVRTSSGGPLRVKITIAAILFSVIALAALLILQSSWLSPDWSQRFGFAGLHVMSQITYWSAAAGFICSFGSYGRVKYVSLLSCVVTAGWLLVLSTGAAIGGTAQARHAVRYFIPNGYIGWVEVKYGVPGAPPDTIEKGEIQRRFDSRGLCETSSALEEGLAKDEYLYYMPNGSTIELPDTILGNGGKIWSGEIASAPERANVNQFFYVGTEEQFKHGVNPGGIQP